RAGADDAAPAQPAEVAHDRAGLDDGAGTDAAAVDHAARADDDIVLEDELVVGKEVQDAVLEDLHARPDPHRAVRVPADLHAGADDGAAADHTVAGDLRAVEKDRARRDRRHLVTVRVAFAHVASGRDAPGMGV